jgi:iron complex outermembrane receptor protein
LSDGFLNNSAGRNNDSESWNGNLKFYWDDGKGTRATLGLSFATHELGAQPLVLRNGGDFYDRASNLNEQTEIDQNQQSLTIHHDLDSGTLTSITNRNDWDMNSNLLDIDLTSVAYDTNNPNPLHHMTSSILQTQTNWSQELKLDSQNNDENEWSVGLFYSDDEIEGVATRFVGMDIETKYALRTENMAGFASLKKTLSDADAFGLSARFDHYDKGMYRINTMLPPPPYDESKDFSGISGTMTWQRELSESTTLDFGIGYAEKPGGFSAFTSTSGQEIFSEEKITSYEASLDLSPSETWQVNLTAFFNDIEDYQFELNGVGMDYYLENADEVSIYGLEIDSIWNLGGGWSFGASYGLTESEFDQVSALPTLVGKQLPFVPDQSLSLVLGHQLENGFSYQIGSRTVGKTYFWDNTGTNTDDVINSYTLVDANFGYVLNDWNINVFGSNLTDEEYYTSLVSNLKSPVITSAPGVVGSPRVIGLSVSREF